MPDLALHLAAVLVLSIIGVAAYVPLARRFGIVAVPNERTLHQGSVPRGGGAVVVLVFLASLAWLYVRGDVPRPWFIALFGGGVAISVVGFVDDIVDLSTRTRVLVHLAVALWAVGWLGGLERLDLGVTSIELGLVGLPLTVLGLIWMINLYNFTDGIDGMATSGAVFVCAAAAGLMAWHGGSPAVVPLAVLATASVGFLVFNWPPARLFLGDAGSGFYGYALGVIVLATVNAGQLSLWTWIILLGYYIGDTTTTVVLRMRRVRRFWGTHRSHAYQNLARVWDDHLRVTSMVLAIDLAWLLPLAIASVRWPSAAPLLAVLALAPIVVLTLRYGPRYAG